MEVPARQSQPSLRLFWDSAIFPSEKSKMNAIVKMLG